MSRKLFYWMTVASAVLTAVLFSGCKEEAPVELNPEWEWIEKNGLFEDGVLNVPAEGGHFDVAYVLENVPEGTQVETVCESDWVFADAYLPGKIAVAVKPNEGRAREAEFSVKVIGAAADAAPIPSVCVKQAASEILPQPDPDQDPSFKVNLVAIDDFLSVWLSVRPVDKEMKYFVGLATEKDLRESGQMDNDQALFEADMKNKPDLVHAFKNAYVGDNEGIIFKYLYPNEKYIFYVYGAKLEKGRPVRLTEVVRTPVATTEVPTVKSCFRHDYLMNGNLIRIHIEPQEYDGYYYPTLKECNNGTDPEFLKYDIYSEWMNVVRRYSESGFSDEEIIDLFCVKGDFTSSLMEIEPNKEYFFTIVPVNEECMLCSDIRVDVFRSGSRLNPSYDNEFNIKVTDITSGSAKVTVIPTIDDEPYAVAVLDHGVDSMSDEDIVAEVLENGYDYSDGTYTGTYDLYPDHEYTVVVFGYYSKITLTPVFRKKFRTSEMEMTGDLKISAELDAFYDCEEIAGLDPEFGYDFWTPCLVFFNVIIDHPEKTDYYHIGFFSKDFINEENISDQELVGRLQEKPRRYVADGMNHGAYVPFSKDLVIAAVAVDKEGRLSQLHKSEYYLEWEDRSPAQDFIDRMNGKAAFPRIIVPFTAE